MKKENKKILVAGVWMDEAKAAGRMAALAFGDKLLERRTKLEEEIRNKNIKKMQEEGFTESEITMALRAEETACKFSTGQGTLHNVYKPGKKQVGNSGMFFH